MRGMFVLAFLPAPRADVRNAVTGKGEDLMKVPIFQHLKLHSRPVPRKQAARIIGSDLIDDREQFLR